MGSEIVASLGAIVVATLGAFGASFAIGLIAARLGLVDARDVPHAAQRKGEPSIDA